MKKNLLLVLPFLPYPLESGGHQAVFSEIDVLRERYNVYLTYRRKRNDLTEVQIFNGLWDNVKALPYEAPADRSLLHYVSRKLQRLERKIWKDKPEFLYERELRPLYTQVDAEYETYLRGLVDRYRIDAVVVEFANSLAVVEALPPQVKKIFVHHEIRFARMQEFLQEKQLDSVYFRSLYTALKSEEIGFLNLYDSIVVFSDVDAQKLRDAGVKASIVPSFFLVTSSNLELQVHESKPVLTFVGPEHHSPNFWGLQSFLDFCWNKIRSVANVELHIIGKWSDNTRNLWEQRFPGVRFVGFVENLQDALAGSVMIVPIDVGSGIRTKILEAAFMGIPVVTTEIGVEGIPLVNGIDCLIAKNVSEMCTPVLSLIGNANLRQMLARNAYDSVKRNYSRERLLDTRMLAIE